jgi:hypothetical protein
MTEPIHPHTPDETTPDETFTWTTEAASAGGHADAGPDSPDATGATRPTGDPAAGGTATGILESIREAVDDLAERATPTMRAFSARAAELAATAADRAAPLAKRAGEATSDASGKLATKSRTWAADLRSSMAASDAGTPSTDNPDVSGPTATDAPPPPAPDAKVDSSDGPTPA